MKKLFLVLPLISASAINLCSAQNWASVGSGINRYINATAIYNGELYAAGSFDTAGGIYAANIAKWNGATWSAVGGGIGGYGNYSVVNALISYNGNLYAGGYFDSAGGIYASNIAMWNGTNWSALTAGVKGYNGPSVLTSMVIYNGDLYVGGEFDTVGGLRSQNIAKWDGTTWTAIGSGFSIYRGISAMISYDSVLYAAGDFDSVGGIYALGIAQWNGTTWSALGKGINPGNSRVGNMVIYHHILYAGGFFDSVGGFRMNLLSTWDGVKWDSVVSTPFSSRGIVASMMVANDLLFVGGWFPKINGLNMNNIATFNGTNWDSLGSGFKLQFDTGTVSTLANYNSEIYAGGSIIASGNTPIRSIARWPFPTGISSIKANVNSVSVFPNPSSGSFTLSLSNIPDSYRDEKCTLEIYNVMGEKVQTSSLPSPEGEGASLSYNINLTSQPNGVYFYRVLKETGELVGSGKVVIEK